MNLLQEGGPLFMYTILICVIVCVVFIVKAFLKGDVDVKTQKLLKHVGLFALVWGFLGFMIGIIGAMDAIAIANDISVPVLAWGLRVGLLSPAFGMVAFLIARLGLIGLTLKEK
ncbi:hypothetical protein LPB136_13230 [Tenacibaculum todarodis]|uniref:MotA/TolQ/ExbB proton channel domain-containing protein n=1 Tax=Tenacibaculum todarodis TaxID=1850252 RepID=A0A1L3JM94_9FLAO|nr:hypothetical protein [Tenacibaculum todarodis]APG66276.1 hypothetical protein LPB136_13230 [Tenacibaculum todarodis]